MHRSSYREREAFITETRRPTLSEPIATSTPIQLQRNWRQAVIRQILAKGKGGKKPLLQEKVLELDKKTFLTPFDIPPPPPQPAAITDGKRFSCGRCTTAATAAAAAANTANTPNSKSCCQCEHNSRVKSAQYSNHHHQHHQHQTTGSVGAGAAAGCSSIPVLSTNTPRHYHEESSLIMPRASALKPQFQRKVNVFAATVDDDDNDTNPSVKSRLIKMENQIFTQAHLI
uniref:Uncharacterized protein n=1 Tax=Glossina pallidipes TaxID=7398 RepID=A0A1B0A2A0_GLOPL